MNVGIVCYASVGGSGIVATELAKGLARRGHEVRLISSEPPVRLGDFQAGLAFHAVRTPGYPLFREPQYLLTLANKIVEVCREAQLDIIHAHYAVPHATAAYLARQILAASGEGHVPRVITTLHGTDVTLIGSDASYLETVAFSIDQSDGVTAVSGSLRDDTYRQLPVRARIEVIPNFLDCRDHRRIADEGLASRYRGGRPDTKLVIHVSNFRPVKRVGAVVELFRRIREQVPARLLLVGDGPDLSTACRRARELGLAGDVEPLGEQELVVPLLSVADLCLLPSAQESFGVAALEAMACSVPVVASRVGGLPEVITDGESGFLRDPEDLDGMTACAVRLLTDAALHRRIAAGGWRRVHDHFCAEEVVPRYEAFYKAVLLQDAAAVRDGAAIPAQSPGS
ncbi:MAG: N-acetyl-alpha-D-glucosaminyl L-malate synthase BshA [Acidobacteria bacterium]|nr:N-acetyl-alpha-D-glucosaminyl L-malate synthase BshA [Acidobacteriota bacterium]